MGFNIFKYEKAKVTLWEHHFRAFNREMVNISGLNLVNEASNATEVEMESCSESMAPGAWSSASPSLTIDKFKNDGHPKVNHFSLRIVKNQAILFAKSTSERSGSDIERL